MTDRTRARWLDAGAALLLALLNVILYRKVVWLWWTYDDPFNLHCVMTHHAIDPFISRAFWPQQLFTPLMMTAFSAEVAAVGLNAARWYAINIALAAIASIAIYFAVRLFFDRLPSLTAAALFAAAVPMCSVVVQLSTVHYFISIIFIALATIVYVVAVRRNSVLLTIVSALCYLAAMLAKEVAVPLPLFLHAIPSPAAAGEGGRRPGEGWSRLVTPHWIALVLYFIWRRAVIGTFLGAYSWVIPPGQWPELMLKLPWRVILAMAGANLIVGLPLLALMLIGVVLAARQSRHALLLVIVGAIVVMGPILPLAKEVNRRYVLVPWLAWSVAFVAGAASLRNPRHRALLLGIAPLLLIVTNRQEWTGEFATRLRMSNEARFMVDMPTNGLLARPTTPPATMRELNWVKIEQIGRPAGASWYYDDFYLCSHDIAGKRVFVYDAPSKSFPEITPRAPEIGKRYCGSIRNDVPLFVRFRYNDPALYWDLGPYTRGTYTAVLADGYEAFKIPPKEALNLPGITTLPIRIRYDSPEGWTTYSPGFDLDVKRQPSFAWRR